MDAIGQEADACLTGGVEKPPGQVQRCDARLREGNRFFAIAAKSRGTNSAASALTGSLRQTQTAGEGASSTFLASAIALRP